MADVPSETAEAKPAEELPEALYHYCGVEAFFGIVKSKELWLSNAYFTNDYSEHKWALEKATERFDAAAAHEDPDFSGGLQQLLRGFRVPPHVACFSSKGDLLSQWRAYSEDADGFAIGFSFESIRKHCVEHAGNGIPVQLLQVCYGEKEQDRLLEEAIIRCRQRSEEERRSGGDQFRAVVQSFADIWTAAAICKNHGFHEECEFRIVLMPLLRKDHVTAAVVPDVGTSQLKFRASKRGIIPYYTLSFPGDAISEIRLGPKNYARGNVDALRSLLRTYDYDVDKTKIIPSEATYQ
jgi:hypothetical protein